LLLLLLLLSDAHHASSPHNTITNGAVRNAATTLLLLLLLLVAACHVSVLAITFSSAIMIDNIAVWVVAIICSDTLQQQHVADIMRAMQRQTVLMNCCDCVHEPL
jgi:hypothetical protein